MPSSGKSTFSGCEITTGCLVRTNYNQPRVSQLPMHRPFDECHLNDDLRTHPVGAHARESLGFREGRLRNLECIELRTKTEQELGIEPRPNFSGKDEVVALVKA